MTKEELKAFNKAVGERIKQLRLKAQFDNYEKFAYTHDLPRAQYGRYEKGQDMQLSSLYKVVNAFGLTMNEFFAEGFEGLPKQKSSAKSLATKGAEEAR
jgi:hypothetical protein